MHSGFDKDLILLIWGPSKETFKDPSKDLKNLIRSLSKPEYISSRVSAGTSPWFSLFPRCESHGAFITADRGP